MEFRIADTFTDSLANLTKDEQTAVKTAAFDLQMNPASPGMQFHRLDKAKDQNFWSVRVNRDVRLIIHRTAASILLCYVAHHDDAYRWAERRKLETHPKTGAAQMVEIRETVREIITPVFPERFPLPAMKAPLFGQLTDDELLSYGVPTEWLRDVRDATEDTLLLLADHLPMEAAEALLELATGGRPTLSQPAQKDVPPFEHPDALRRFRVMTNVEELAQTLEYPWEKWTIFLHPAQRSLVERDFSGPSRVSGSAGTGKTIVALHRAVFLARKHQDARVLLTTFSEPLANALRVKLRRLISKEPRLAERLEVHAIDDIGRRLYELNIEPLNLVSEETVRQLVMSAAKESHSKRGEKFFWTEWEEVVDAWQVNSPEGYRDVKRVGRKTRLSEEERVRLWPVFAKVKKELAAKGVITTAGLFDALSTKLTENKYPAFEFVVVDEAQDVSISQLRFLAALAGNRRNSLFFAGDLGQRIFQQPFSWKALGVDIRGRSSTLRVNYRTSHQIRTQADLLLGSEIADVDGNTESRRGTVSVFNGEKPRIATFDSKEEENAAVSVWLKERAAEGMQPHEIGIFVRSSAELNRAKDALRRADLPYKVLDDGMEVPYGYASIGTMHLAKGLEFRAVSVMACDDEVIPLQERIQTALDEADLEDVYNTERHLLYVACTRARDCLLVTCGGATSEFLEDLSPQLTRGA